MEMKVLTNERPSLLTMERILTRGEASLWLQRKLLNDLLHTRQ
jgi:hypothetical protein